MKLLSYVALAWSLAAMGAGITLGYLAWQTASQPRAMLAAVLLLTAPILAGAMIFVRRHDATGIGTPPARALIDSISGVDRSLRILKLCRAHIGVACSWLLPLWFCQWGGYFRVLHFALFYTVACVAAAGAFLPWLGSCERRLYDERAEYRQRLGELEAAM